MNTRLTAKRLLLYGTLLFALLFAVAYRIAKPPIPHDPLRGDDDDSKVALGTLLKTTPKDQQQALLRKYVSDSSPNLRFNAIEALGDLFPKSSHDLIENALQDNSAPIRIWGIESAHKLEHPNSMRLYMAGVQDSDTNVKGTALQALAILFAKPCLPEDKSIVPTLMREFSTAPSELRPIVAHILAKLTNNAWEIVNNAPPDKQEETLKKWLDWWKTAEPTWVKEPYSTVAAQAPTRSDPAPDFTLNDVDGKRFNLAENRGRVVLINFWGTWCGPCRPELPHLQKLHETLKDQPFDVLGLALNEDGEEKGLKERSGKIGLTYRQAVCTREIQHAYGEVTEVPITYLIDKKGNIRYRWENSQDYSTFSHAIQRLLKE